MCFDWKQTGFKKKILEIAREQTRLLREILMRLPLPTYWIQMEEFMSIGNIVAGTTGQISAVLFENGVPYTAPADSTYVFTPALACSDPLVTISPATVDASNGTVPLANQFLVTVEASDAGGTAVFTATATDPNGGTATGTLSTPITAEAQNFTITLTQLA